MSAKIYFRTGPSQKIQRLLISAASNVHRLVAPKHALTVAKRLLLTPTRLPAKNVEPQGLVKSLVTTSYGKVATYRLGSGPAWLLIHGWSGATHQFYPLMQHIAEQGFTAVAFDHIAHGASEGNASHLPAFIEGIDCVAQQETSLAGVVAHSMGGAALLQSNSLAISKLPLLLIAPVLNYVENMYTTVRRSGYSMKLFEQVTKDIAGGSGLQLEHINPVARLQNRQTNSIIIHDPGDRLANFSVCAAAAENSESIQLIEAERHGHGRIMKCKPTMAAFDQLSHGLEHSQQGAC